ncbi:unnamed protein product [Pleuronectes platessa]|uniref:Uncharacterized protein n=1 Tax=Pleuronectes platessa TaxID=8262 RepID=A0A9N7VFJ8_PLEPL|nr:unnamed protein product [Pleuronectes platessa]
MTTDSCWQMLCSSKPPAACEGERMKKNFRTCPMTSAEKVKGDPPESPSVFQAPSASWSSETPAEPLSPCQVDWESGVWLMPLVRATGLEVATSSLNPTARRARLVLAAKSAAGERAKDCLIRRSPIPASLSSWPTSAFTSRCESVRNPGRVQMAGNASEMTVAQSKPQDSVSGAREPDTAERPAAAEAYRLGLPAASLLK